jgi:shikimate dehydrogenase
MDENKQIKTCLVIGHPVSHSLSPVMHTAAFKALGIDPEYIFLAENVAPGDLKNEILKFKERKIHAIAVTIPHKEAIIKYLDDIDETAKEIGAVNTVLNINGILKGYNTDWRGAINTLQKFTSLKNKKISVLGSGGTARAIIYGLTKGNCAVNLFCRNNTTGLPIAKQFKCKIFSWDNLEDAYDADILINTTPIGMDDKDSPLLYNGFTKKHIVFDVNYHKGDTRFITFAKLKNAKTIDGLELLLQQGKLQFELYTKLKAPEKAMREALNPYRNYSESL